MKQVIFKSRKEAEASQPSLEWAVISINGLDPARLQAGWLEVLRVEFDDVDVAEEPHILFSDYEARQIEQFVARVNDKGVEGILVHCNAGISRSAAVAKWIAEKHDLPFPAGYMLYNKHVYRVLMEMDAENQYLATLPTTGLRAYVMDLAKQNGVVYQKTNLDELAEVITRLSDDEVKTDDVQDTLLALLRAGVLNKGEWMQLLINYLRELKSEGKL